MRLPPEISYQIGFLILFVLYAIFFIVEFTLSKRRTVALGKRFTSCEIIFKALWYILCLILIGKTIYPTFLKLGQCSKLELDFQELQCWGSIVLATDFLIVYVLFLLELIQALFCYRPDKLFYKIKDNKENENENRNENGNENEIENISLEITV